MNAKKIVLLVVGVISFILGTIGALLPVIPTVPFYLVTLYCFARGSKRFEDWFRGTWLYKKYLESYIEKRGMKLWVKIGILTSMGLFMGIGGYFMARKEIWVPCIILAIIWIGYFIYFTFFVKTIKEEK
ncbi:MAG: YbaN family protein [Lachnospiraceae bacterium]|nr:YbaN family protein [Lachnospiraceae bacterium]